VNRGRQGASTNKVAPLHDDPAQRAKRILECGIRMLFLFPVDAGQQAKEDPEPGILCMTNLHLHTDGNEACQSIPV
jgi:hypothetical protein